MRGLFSKLTGFLPKRALPKRAIWLLAGGSLAAAAVLFLIQGRKEHRPSNVKVYQAERLYLPCTLADEAGTMVLSVNNDSTRYIPRGWNVSYRPGSETDSARRVLRLREAFIPAAEIREPVPAEGWSAGPCVAWTMVPKEPLVESRPALARN